MIADEDKAEELACAFEEEGKKGTNPRPDIQMPLEFSKIHKYRYVTLCKALFTRIWIERGDQETRLQHYLNMYKFFGAPAVV